MAETKNGLFAAAGKRLVEILNGCAFSVEGIPTLTVKYPDAKDGTPGGWKKKPIMSSWSLGLEESYVGKSGKLLLVLRIIDGDGIEFSHVEVSLPDADKYIPEIGLALAEKLNEAGVATEGVEDVPGLVKLMIEDMGRARSAEDDEIRKINPLWGMF